MPLSYDVSFVKRNYTKQTKIEQYFKRNEGHCYHIFHSELKADPGTQNIIKKINFKFVTSIDNVDLFPHLLHGENVLICTCDL